MTLHVCARPGCIELARRTYCEPHQREAERTRRPSSRLRYGADFNEATRLRILERDGYLCQLRRIGCRAIATTVDHLLPRSHGGGNEDSNLVAACAWCNTSKGARVGAGGARSS